MIHEVTIKIDDDECPWFKEYEPVWFSQSITGEQSVSVAGQVIVEHGIPSQSRFRLIVKPRKKAEKWVPFGREDVAGLIGKVVKKIGGSGQHLISSVYVEDPPSFGIGDGEFLENHELLCDYTFADGSPCGKLVTEYEGAAR